LLAPSPRAQADRLLGRRKDSEEAIRERLSKADGEIRYAQDCGAYQHFVINEVIEDTVERITRIIEEKRNT
jgi:guanylate kinase